MHNPHYTAGDCRFGVGCAFLCRCYDPEETCDPDRGFCKSGCQKGLLDGTDWYGPGCLIGNAIFICKGSQVYDIYITALYHRHLIWISDEFLSHSKKKYFIQVPVIYIYLFRLQNKNGQEKITDLPKTHFRA